MKVLLMLPIWDRKAQWGVFHRGAGNNNFSYGLVSIAAYLEERGIDVEICDPQFIDGGREGLKNYLISREYDVVGITCYTPTVVEVYNTAKFVKECLPSAKVVLGGPHPTSFPMECLNECPECDYVVMGEGEESLFELVCALRKARRLDGIRGIACRCNGEVLVGERRPFLDVDKLPLPAYHLQDPTSYRLQPTAYHKLPTVTLLVSRGCPYPCTFCHVYEILGRKVRYKSVEKVMTELDHLRSNFGARGFMFQDGTFTYDRDWTEKFCEAIKREKWHISWLCYTRADKVDYDLLKQMKDAGCWGISFGVESANQKSLDLIKKGMTVEQNARSIQDSLKLGMYVTATYMLGLPGESVRDVENTIDFAKKMGTHIAHFFLPLPYPKTHFFQQCQDDGGLDDNIEWSRFSMTDTSAPVYTNPRIGAKTMVALKNRATSHYYLSSKVIWRNLATIRGLDDIKRYKNAVMALSGLWI